MGFRDADRIHGTDGGLLKFACSAKNGDLALGAGLPTSPLRTTEGLTALSETSGPIPCCCRLCGKPNVRRATGTFGHQNVMVARDLVTH